MPLDWIGLQALLQHLKKHLGGNNNGVKIENCKKCSFYDNYFMRCKSKKAKGVGWISVFDGVADCPEGYTDKQFEEHDHIEMMKNCECPYFSEFVQRFLIRKDETKMKQIAFQCKLGREYQNNLVYQVLEQDERLRNESMRDGKRFIDGNEARHYVKSHVEPEIDEFNIWIRGYHRNQDLTIAKRFFPIEDDRSLYIEKFRASMQALTDWCNENLLEREEKGSFRTNGFFGDSICPVQTFFLCMNKSYGLKELTERIIIFPCPSETNMSKNFQWFQDELLHFCQNYYAPQQSVQNLYRLVIDGDVYTIAREI